MYQNQVVPEELLRESMMNELYGGDEVEDTKLPAIDVLKTRWVQINKS